MPRAAIARAVIVRAGGQSDRPGWTEGRWLKGLPRMESGGVRRWPDVCPGELWTGRMPRGQLRGEAAARRRCRKVA
jgi:hypothetical protein